MNRNSRQIPDSQANLHEPLIFLTAFLLIALLSGLGGYQVGVRTTRVTYQPSSAPISSCPPSPTSFAKPTPTVLLIPTENPQYIENWKTYTNAQWGLSFRYPETWFPQDAPRSSNQGDAVNFFPNEVTPFIGEADRSSNIILTVEYRKGVDTRTNEQVIHDVRQTDGVRLLNVDGRLAIRFDGYIGTGYDIHLGNSKELIFGPSNAELDTVISTIRFANK